MAVVAERPATVSVIKLHPVIGAEIRGVDLSRPLDDDTVRQIRNAWYDHTVLVFRDQKLSEDDQRRFASYFGPVAKRVPPRPGAVGADTLIEWDDMLLVTDNVDANGKPIGALGHGEMWFHSDKCYHRKPHRASFLYGIEIPTEGGHTKFSSSYAAYERLPADVKKQDRRRDGDAGPPIHHRPAHRPDRRYRDHASLPPADHRHQSRLRAQGALRHQPEHDVDRRHGPRRERGAARRRCSTSRKIPRSSTSTCGAPAISWCGTISPACTRAPTGRAEQRRTLRRCTTEGEPLY